MTPVSPLRQFAILLTLSATLILARDAHGQQNWPYIPLVAPAPPPVAREAWVRNAIDRFILARLEKDGLAPAPEAHRRVLLRRVYFDLIGLPPTPGELRAFLEDTSPSAYETVVDRLLKDPRHGERWARFWLDLARYADTAGYEGDPDLPHAWRYRDYVIDSLNRDKPYDLFIKEQIAGDEFAEVLGAGELPLPNPERVVAMTFLRLAPFTEPRGDETRHEMLSEITSTVGSVFLGLSVGCAKCHDHKHDPIPTEDFYRLKAFFATVAIPPPLRGDGFQIGGPLPAAFYRDGEAEWASRSLAALATEKQTIAKKLAILTKEITNNADQSSGIGLQSMGASFGNNYVFSTTPVADSKRHLVIASSNGSRWQFETDGSISRQTGSLSGSNRGHWFGHIAAPKHVSLGQHTSGTGTPRGTGHAGLVGDLLIYDHELTKAERTAIAAWSRHKYDQVANDRPKPPTSGLRFWLDASDLDADSDTPNPAVNSRVPKWTDRVGGMELVQQARTLQPKLATLGARQAAAVQFDGSFLKAAAATASFLGDKSGSVVMILTATHQDEGYGFEVGGDGQFLSTVIYPTARKTRSLEDLVNDPAAPGITEEQRHRFKMLSIRQRAIPVDIKRLQPKAMSLRHTFGPPYEPGVPTSRVMIRGEYNNPGEVVKPGFLSVVTGHQDPAPIRLDPFKRWPTRSRRMALAKWIASRDNPLTARVMANRLWHWHFGQGIVATPSDFGTMRIGPSHETLLDWLAHKFVTSGWRLKTMHRLMVLSAAYRQASSAENPKASSTDPANRLLWRFRRRRLEAEAVRDSVLSVSGRLNPEHFGLPIFPMLPDDVADRVKWDSSKWFTHDDGRSRKRSIYIYQQRSLSMPFMQAFDALVCEQSRPRRRASVTPLQALAMYNGRFVNQEAHHFAARILKLAGDDVDRQIEVAFEVAYSRSPSADERHRLKAFLASASSNPLVGLCRVLLNSNEFVYVD